MYPTNTPVDTVLLVLFCVTFAIIFIVPVHGPSGIFFDLPYGTKHFVTDATLVFAFTLTVLLYSYRCYLISTKSLAQHYGIMKTGKTTLLVKLLVVVQVFAVTCFDFIMSSQKAFHRQLSAFATVRTMSGIDYLKKGCLVVIVLSLVPSTLYTWLKCTGRMSDQPINQPRFGSINQKV